MKNVRKFLLPVLAVAAALVLTACSSNSGKTTIVIGTDSATKPFTYADNSNLTGYDIEVAKAVFAKLPEYQVEFKTMDFASISTSIDNERVQMGANDFGWNSARDEKYYFSSPLSKSNNAVAVKSDSQTYANLSDLAGLRTEGNPASNYSTAIENFNKTTSNPINITYVSGQTPFSNRLTDIVNGKTDFVLYDAISLAQTIKEQGYDKQLKVENIQMPNADSHDGFEYFLFAKNDSGKTLQTKVNKALKELQADGTLQKLSEKYLGGNYVPDASQFG